MGQVVRLNVRRVNQTQAETPYQRTLNLIVDFDEQMSALIRDVRKTNSYAADVLTQASIDARFHLVTAAEAVCYEENVE